MLEDFCISPSQMRTRAAWRNHVLNTSQPLKLQLRFFQYFFSASRRRQQHCGSKAGGTKSWWHTGKDPGYHLHQGIDLLSNASFQHLHQNSCSLEMSGTTQLQVLLVVDGISRLLTEDLSSPQFLLFCLLLQAGQDRNRH